MATVNGPTCLHLVAGDGRAALEDCLSLCVAGDALLFVDAGVLHLLRPLSELPGGVEAHFLAADLQARGLLEAARGRQLGVLDDAAFCGLLATHERCLTWT